MITTIISTFSSPAWVGAVGTVIGVVLTYLIQKGNNKKELTINDREHQSDLIIELREMMIEQKEEIEGLRKEIRVLQSDNTKLLVENKELQNKVQNLTEKLDSINKNNKKR